MGFRRPIISGDRCIVEAGYLRNGTIAVGSDADMPVIEALTALGSREGHRPLRGCRVTRYVVSFSGIRILARHRIGFEIRSVRNHFARFAYRPFVLFAEP